MRTEEKLSQLSDEEILQGFIGFDTPIIREYFYGYCRVAYCIYDKKYNLKNKPGMDFFSLAHEYFLYLRDHDFKPLGTGNPQCRSRQGW